jgi:MFS family permease
MVVRVTDRWGKARSVLIGTAVMIPATLLLAVGGGVLPLGLAALLIFIAGFEFAMVASISLSTELVPGRPAAGFGLMIGAGTMGRVVASYMATVLYQQAGMWLPSLTSTVMVAATVAGVARYVHITRSATVDH